MRILILVTVQSIPSNPKTLVEVKECPLPPLTLMRVPLGVATFCASAETSSNFSLGEDFGWYLNYLKAGAVRDLSYYKLSASNRFGEFRHWFHMPLFKVEQLTGILIMNGCITEPRSLICRAEYRE